jgi:hypothetical protein
MQGRSERGVLGTLTDHGRSVGADREAVGEDAA